MKQRQSAVRLKSDELKTAVEAADEGRSDDIVARQLGVSRDTLRKAVYVARAIDHAEASRNGSGVEAIRRYKTVNAAYREALRFSGPGGGVEEVDPSQAATGHEWREPCRFSAMHTPLSRTDITAPCAREFS